MPIYFYSQREEPYGCFSNFSPHGVHSNGKWFPTVEHYFQAMKFEGSDHAHTIRKAASPKQAKALAWRREFPLRPDWDEIRDDVMIRGVREKFTKHEKLRQLLLATGQEELVENAPGDFYWGCGADGSGENRLGKILMQVRTELASNILATNEESEKQEQPLVPQALFHHDLFNRNKN
jgi:N-glycosidase YbiA